MKSLLSPQVKFHFHAARYGYFCSFLMVGGSWAYAVFNPQEYLSMTHSGVFGSILAVVSIAFYFLYLRLDERKEGYWYHKRLKPLFLAACLTLVLLNMGLKMSPPMMGLFLALAVYHRHQRFARKMFCELLQTHEGVRRKIIALEADLSQTRLAVPHEEAHGHRTADPLKMSS